MIDTPAESDVHLVIAVLRSTSPELVSSEDDKYRVGRFIESNRLSVDQWKLIETALTVHEVGEEKKVLWLIDNAGEPIQFDDKSMADYYCHGSRTESLVNQFLYGLWGECGVAFEPPTEQVLRFM